MWTKAEWREKQKRLRRRRIERKAAENQASPLEEGGWKIIAISLPPSLVAIIDKNLHFLRRRRLRHLSRSLLISILITYGFQHADAKVLAGQARTVLRLRALRRKRP